jgi:hypothetical protein
MVKKLLLASTFTSVFYSYAQTTVFKEDFENEESVALWKLYDRDGDGENWEILNAELNELPNFSGNLAVSFSWYLEAFTRIMFWKVRLLLFRTLTLYRCHLKRLQVILNCLKNTTQYM